MKDILLKELDFHLIPLVVQADLPLDDLIEHFVEEPTMRHLYVVNKENKLLGIIERKNIFSYIFSEHLGKPERISELFKTISAKLAADIYTSNFTKLKITDTVETAIQEMFKSNAFELPIVDEENIPVATITAWDLIKLWKNNQ